MGAHDWWDESNIRPTQFLGRAAYHTCICDARGPGCSADAARVFEGFASCKENRQASRPTTEGVRMVLRVLGLSRMDERGTAQNLVPCLFFLEYRGLLAETSELRLDSCL